MKLNLKFRFTFSFAMTVGLCMLFHSESQKVRPLGLLIAGITGSSQKPNLGAGNRLVLKPHPCV